MVDSQVRDEFADLNFSHLGGMTFVMKENEAANPTDIGLFGSQAKVPYARHGSHLIQELL